MSVCRSGEPAIVAEGAESHTPGSAIVPATFPVAAHAAPKPVVRIDVTLYNRTKGLVRDLDDDVPT